MKDANVIVSTQLLNLTELTIEPVEICWNKVKMTSSRWITCCHRKLKKSLLAAPATPGESGANGSRYCRPKSAVVGERSFEVSDSARHSSHYSNTLTPRRTRREEVPSQYVTLYGQRASEHFISTSYQTGDQTHQTPFRNFPNGFTHLTPSSSSPVSSLYDRKSSASSSASSNHSSYSGAQRDLGTGQLASAMRHSKSTMEIGSCGRTGKGAAVPSPYDGYSHSLTRPTRGERTRPLLSIENTITIINPRDGALISCQTDEGSNCAQISPEINVIAVSNEFWIAFYSIATNDQLGVLELPRSWSFWTWISGDTVAVVSCGEVLHWTLPNPERDSNCIRAYDRKRLVFEVDPEIADNQIINYAVDPLFANWCALNTLYVDENGDVCGKVQVFSHLYKQSQCIEAHSCVFTDYRFEDSDQNSTLLVAVRREKDDRWKLFIHELGPIPEGALSHRPISHVLSEHKSRPKKDSLAPKDTKPPSPVSVSSSSTSGVSTSGPHSDGSMHPVRCGAVDIPTHIACDSSVGLVFLLSKYGSLYICDIETGQPLYYDSIHDLTGDSALFTLSYDNASKSLLSVSRAGFVLSLQVNLEALLETNKNGMVAPKVLERIQNRILQQRSSTVTNEKVDPFDPPTTTDSNYSSSPTTSELSASLRMSSIHDNHNQFNFEETDSIRKDSFPFKGSGRRPKPIYIESDSEEVTRL